jgi:hypothetical protein
LNPADPQVIKLSRIQPKALLYRGMTGMKLPKSFLLPDNCGVRSGVEYGFMSATLDRAIAQRYSKGHGKAGLDEGLLSFSRLYSLLYGESLLRKQMPVSNESAPSCI